MKRKSERYQSRQKTPWDSKEDLTPTQKFIVQNYKEHYMQKHPLLTETAGHSTTFVKLGAKCRNIHY